MYEIFIYILVFKLHFPLFRFLQSLAKSFQNSKNTFNWKPLEIQFRSTSEIPWKFMSGPLNIHIIFTTLLRILAYFPTSSFWFCTNNLQKRYNQCYKTHRYWKYMKQLSFKWNFTGAVSFRFLSTARGYNINHY